MAHQLLDRVIAVSSLALQANVIGDQAHALSDAGHLFPEFDLGLAHYTGDGSLVQNTGTSTIWDEEIVKAELAKIGRSAETPDLTAFLEVIVDPATGKKTVLVADRMEDGSLAAGAVTLDKLAQQALGEIFEPAGQASLLIVDENYELLYRSGPLYWTVDGLSDHPGVVRALDGQRGATNHQQEEGEQIIAYSPIAGANWALVIEEPWQSVADPFLESTELAPLMLIPALLVAAVAIWFGFWKVVRPLQALEQQTFRLAEGHYEAVEAPVGGIAEVRNLQSGLIRMARRVGRAQRQLRGYLASVTDAQEKERSRLARDLHDETIQSLVALIRKVQLTRISPSGQPAAEQLDDIESMTNQIIDDLRLVARGLRPSPLEELGLAPAIKLLAQETGAAANVAIAFTATGTEQRLSQDTELALYRIAQEALSNIAQHAQASCAEVSLDFQEERLLLKIADDGRGFDVHGTPAEMAPIGHFGLLGMQERAQLIGAHLKVESTPHQGTIVIVTLSTNGNLEPLKSI